MDIGAIVRMLGEIVDVVGVAAIVAGLLYAIVDGVLRASRRDPDLYERFRRVLGRAILIGLELLVAADIIRTVAVTPTLESVAVLALIVLVRTFLSWSLQLEVTGHWPWAAHRAAAAGADATAAGAVPAADATGAVPHEAAGAGGDGAATTR